MAVVMSALRVGRPLPPGRFLVLDHRPIARLGTDLIGNRTRDLPACGIMPQPTMLPRAHKLKL
jgi:hypothetical protein